MKIVGMLAHVFLFGLLLPTLYRRTACLRGGVVPPESKCLCYMSPRPLRLWGSF